MPIGSGNLGMGLVFTLQDRVSRNAAKISNSINRMDNSIKTSAQSITSNFDTVASSFVSTATTVGALIAPFAIATKKAADFEAQMSDVGAKSLATSEQLKKLTEQALELSSAQGTAQFTAKQVGEGMSFLAMAGFSTEQIMASIKDTMMLASAGSLSLAESADIASNVLTGFNLKAEEMGRVSDVLALASVKSNQSVSQLGEAMKFLAPTAAAMGISLEEATATTMMLANAGLQGSLGTRALGTALAARLTKPTKQAKIMMQELGFEVFDTQGKFVGMIELVRRMQNATNDLTDEQRQAAIATIFGGESIQELNVLMSQQVDIMEDGTKKTLQGADALAHFTKMAQGARGTALEIARKQLDNFKGEVTVLMSNIDAALIQVGNALIPILRPIVSALSSIVGSFSSFASSGIGKFVVQLSAGIAALGATIVTLNFAVNVLGKSFMAMARTSIAALAPMAPLLITVGAIAGVIVLVTKSVSEFNAVMNGTKQPATGFLGFMQKIGGIVSATIQLFKSWNGETFTMSQQMRDGLEATGTLDFFTSLASWLTRTIEFVKSMGGAFIDTISPLGEILSESFNSVFDAVWSVMEVFGATNKSLIDVKKGGVTVGKTLGKVFNILTIPLKALAKGISLVAQGIKYIATNWDNMKSTLSSGWDTIVEGFYKGVELFAQGFDFIKSKAEGLVDTVTSFASSFWDAGVEIGENLVMGITNSLAMLEGFIARQVVEIFGAEVGNRINSSVGISANTATAGGGANPADMARIRAVDASRDATLARSESRTIEKSNNKETIVIPKTINLNVDGDLLGAKNVELDDFLSNNG